MVDYFADIKRACFSKDKPKSFNDLDIGLGRYTLFDIGFKYGSFDNKSYVIKGWNENEFLAHLGCALHLGRKNDVLSTCTHIESALELLIEHTDPTVNVWEKNRNDCVDFNKDKSFIYTDEAKFRTLDDMRLLGWSSSKLDDLEIMRKNYKSSILTLVDLLDFDFIEIKKSDRLTLANLRDFSPLLSYNAAYIESVSPISSRKLTPDEITSLLGTD